MLISITEMESRNESKWIDTKNRACYYFDDIVNGTDINFNNILLDKNLYENISVYEISYRTSMRPKPLCIMFDKIDGFIMVLDAKMKHYYDYDY